MTLLGGRRERACHQLEGLGRVDRPASHPTREDVKDGEAIDLALSGRVLGDVGEPELVRGWPVEVPPKQVKRYRPRRLGALRWSPVRDSLISSSTMIEPTVFWPIGFPRPNRSSAETLGTPWVPRDCLWISVISFAVQTRLSAVRESGRFFRA